MGEMGSGARARHSGTAGMATGTTNANTAGSAVGFESTNDGLVAGDCVRLVAAAQQVSA